MLNRLAQIAARQRALIFHNIGDRARGDDFTSPHTGPWPNVNDIVRFADRIFIVLDH